MMKKASAAGEALIALLRSSTLAEVVAHIATISQNCKRGVLSANDTPFAIAMGKPPKLTKPSSKEFK